jgi:hypothetical protein
LRRPNQNISNSPERLESRPRDKLTIFTLAAIDQKIAMLENWTFFGKPPARATNLPLSETVSIPAAYAHQHLSITTNIK